jgi:trehalose 6-phosphate phosphatase
MTDAVRLLTRDRARTALLMDFDGSLSEIVAHPDHAVPRPEVVELLHTLVPRFGRVGIVSGRPVEFLADRLPVPGLDLVGQYGLERRVDGRIVVDERAVPFEPRVADAADRADAELPGVFVERKGTVAVTLHWRGHEELASRVRDWADAIVRDTGLIGLPTRRAVELRPPVGVDKGTAVAELAGPAKVAMFAGDDDGDVAAFRSLAALVEAGALDAAVRVGVRSEESPESLLTNVDLMVDGPSGLVAFLRELVEPA